MKSSKGGGGCGCLLILCLLGIGLVYVGSTMPGGDPVSMQAGAKGFVIVLGVSFILATIITGSNENL